MERNYSFEVTDNLFNQNNTDTLGLSAPAGLQTYTVWEAMEDSDHYCNGVCLAGYAYLLRSNSSYPELVYEGKAKRKGFHYCKSLVYGGNLYVGYATNKEAVEITVVPEESLMLN